MRLYKNDRTTTTMATRRSERTYVNGGTRPSTVENRLYLYKLYGTVLTVSVDLKRFYSDEWTTIGGRWVTDGRRPGDINT